MKYLLLILFPLFSIAQRTPIQLAENVFAMCVKNDETAFKASLPDKDALRALVEGIKGAQEVSDEMVEAEYQKNIERALKGFRLVQSTAKELEIDLSQAVITKKEVEGKTINLVDEEREDVGKVKAKEITIFFSCNGKKLAFIISDALKIKGRWYPGHDIIAIHWLD